MDRRRFWAATGSMASRRRTLLLGGLVLLVGFAVWYLSSEGNGTNPATEEFKPERRRGIPQTPITEIPTQSVRQACEVLDPNELVLGVTVAGQSRAYPLRQMLLDNPQRKVLNDTLGGRAIAATY
jgi:hypothetical protein